MFAMYCDCYDFNKNLMNFSNEILDKEDGRLQWKLFEQFLMNYTQGDTQDVSVINEVSSIPAPFTTACSLKICSLLVPKLEFIRRYATLSTLLVDLMSVLHVRLCGRSYVQQLWNFERSAISDRGSLMFVAALHSSDDFKKLLLNYGVLRRLCGDSPTLIYYMECYFNHFMFCINDNNFNEELSYKRKRALKIIKRFHEERSCGERECSKRIFLSVMAIYSITVYLLNLDKTFIEKCLSVFEMYFAGTQEPLLSAFEVKSILFVCFKLMNKFHLFDIYCQEFNKFMPGCPAIMEPRRLSQLARCEIRQNLNLSSLPMPSAIDKLLLPTSLNKFLLCDVSDVIRKKENGSLEKPMTQLQLPAQSALAKKQKIVMNNTKKRRLNDDEWEFYIVV